MAVYSEQKSNLLIQNMWSKVTYCILDMWVVHTDTSSYVLKTPDKNLLTIERDKNVSTWTLAFSSAKIFSHSSYQWMALWVLRRSPFWNTWTASLEPSCGNPNQRNKTMPRVDSISQWWVSTTTLSKDTGFPQVGSEYRGLSGITVLDSFSTGKIQPDTTNPEIYGGRNSK